MMKQQDNNITEINQIVLDHVSPSSMDSYLHFPNPFLDAADTDDLFLSHFLTEQQQQQLFVAGNCWEEEENDQEQQNKAATTTTTTTIGVVVEKKKKKILTKKCNRKTGSSSTKRRGKKDRHSKICTAQGPRDRRMRLSLQIARKFFDLQDMLGFDKASNTIDWLLSNSTSAIKDLKNTVLVNNNNNNNNSNSGCCSGSSEVLSEIIRDNNVVMASKHKKTRQLRTVARDSRDRARARARQRTLLKKTKHQISDQLQHCDHHPLSDFPPIHSSSSGNNNNNNETQLETLDYPLLSCPNSIFMPSPLPKPYSFSDSTLLKLP